MMMWERRAAVALVCMSVATSGCSGMSGLIKREHALEDSHRRYQELLDLQRNTARSSDDESEIVSAEDLIREGDRLRDQGSPDRAIWKFLRALRMEPERIEAKERIGFLHLHREPERTITILGEVAENHPERPVAHTGIALASMRVGRVEEAEAAARRATEADPEFALGWATLGTVLDHQRRHAEAQQALLRALELQPGDLSVLNNLGISYLRTGEGPRAEDMFREALRSAPHDAALLNQLGVALSLQGLYDDALDAFHKAGNRQTAHNNLGAVHLSQGRYGLAAEQFEYALLAGGPHTEEVLRNLRAAERRMREGAPVARTP